MENCWLELLRNMILKNRWPIVVTTVAANTAELVNFQKPAAVLLLFKLRPIFDESWTNWKTKKLQTQCSSSNKTMSFPTDLYQTCAETHTCPCCEWIHSANQHIVQKSCDSLCTATFVGSGLPVAEDLDNTTKIFNTSPTTPLINSLEARERQSGKPPHLDSNC